MYIVLCQGENKNIVVLNIDDQNMMHLYIFKGHLGCIFELKSPIKSKCLTYSSISLENKLILNKITFEMINKK